MEQEYETMGEGGGEDNGKRKYLKSNKSNVTFSTTYPTLTCFVLNLSL